VVAQKLRVYYTLFYAACQIGDAHLVVSLKRSALLLTDAATRRGLLFSRFAVKRSALRRALVGKPLHRAEMNSATMRMGGE
jgi:hypothetical protein